MTNPRSCEPWSSTCVGPPVSPRGAEPVTTIGDLAVDLERRRVTLLGEEVHLTPTEYDLLKILLEHADTVLTDGMPLEEVWSAAYRQQAHSLHVYVARLRKNMEADPQAQSPT